MKEVPVSIIIPMRNSETTVLESLTTLSKQTYPIKEIIVVDNLSKDNSVQVVEQYAKNSKIPITLIKRKENRGVAASYNVGVEKSTSEFVILMHSDATLNAKDEITKLVTPLLWDASVVATYSTTINPVHIWDSYNFWQKCLFSQAVGKEKPGLNGKFDCIRKKDFLAINGFDEKRFAGETYIGGEDADLHLRLQKRGKILLSEAKVIHLHYLGDNYSFNDYLANRKMLARTYGRLIRVKWRELPPGALLFGIKPLLAILPFIPTIHVFGLCMLFIFSILYPRQLFLHSSSLRDPHIFLLPFVQIFLVYYETFWMLQAFLSTKNINNRKTL